MDSDILQAISKRAIELCHAEGKPNGPDAVHWLQAHRELHGDLRFATAATPRAE